MKQEILILLKTPLTMQEIQKKLGWTIDRIRYWVDKLEEEGLIAPEVRSTKKRVETGKAKTVSTVYYKTAIQRKITFKNK